MNYHIKPFLKAKGYNLSKLASLMDMSFQKFDHHVRPKQDLSFNFEFFKFKIKYIVEYMKEITQIETRVSNKFVVLFSCIILFIIYFTIQDCNLIIWILNLLNIFQKSNNSCTPVEFQNETFHTVYYLIK